MGLMERLARWIVGRANTTDAGWWREMGYGATSATGFAITQASAMQASAVMACVSIRSGDMAKLPVHVYRSTTGGGRSIAADHPLERLLRRPNAWQTRFEFIEQMEAAYLLRGNAYAVILRDGRGQPTDLIPINPDRVVLFQGVDGTLFYQVARRGLHDMAVLRNVPMMVPEEDILHLRWITHDGLLGMSRIRYARDSIGLSLSQQEHAARLAGNGARPGGILTTEQKLGPDAVENLKRTWSEFQGAQNAGKTAVLEQGFKWQALGMTSVDAEFLESRKFQIAEIARCFEVPLHKLGVQGAGPGSSWEAAEQNYVNGPVTSDAERWEAKLDAVFGLTDAGLFIEFDLNKLLRASIQVRLNALRTGIMGMIYTVNEARRAEGLPDIEGGDVILQPTNVAKLGYEPQGNEPQGGGLGSDATGSAAEGGSGDPAAVPPVTD